MSPNVVITLVGGLLTGLLLWQLNALGDNIDSLRTDMQGQISALRTDMQGQISALRAETLAGFREVNATLLDHTDRLARLESMSDVWSQPCPSKIVPASTLGCVTRPTSRSRST